MDIFLHFAGLALIPLMVGLIIPGLRDIFKLIKTPCRYVRPLESKISIS